MYDTKCGTLYLKYGKRIEKNLRKILFENFHTKYLTTKKCTCNL